MGKKLKQNKIVFHLKKFNIGPEPLEIKFWRSRGTDVHQQY